MHIVVDNKREPEAEQSASINVGGFYDGILYYANDWLPLAEHQMYTTSSGKLRPCWNVLLSVEGRGFYDQINEQEAWAIVT